MNITQKELEESLAKFLDVVLSTRASEATLASLAAAMGTALDVPLSTRASESTLSDVKTNTDNLDVALSTVATESTLSDLYTLMGNLITALGNLKISIEEATIKVPVDIQDHYADIVEISAISAKTSSGNSGDIDVGKYICGEICIDIIGVTGTGTIDITIEGKDQTSGKYKTLFSHTGISATGTYWDTIETLAFKYIRASWTITGFTSVTFSISMEAKS